MFDRFTSLCDTKTPSMRCMLCDGLRFNAVLAIASLVSASIAKNSKCAVISLRIFYGRAIRSAENRYVIFVDSVRDKHRNLNSSIYLNETARNYNKKKHKNNRRLNSSLYLIDS